jgi:hypothetical protein
LKKCEVPRVSPLLCEDDDPTIGLKSGKAKASRETGGFMPWTEGDMALYRAKWPLGTEARLMFDVLHYAFLRLGDAYRFGPPHLRQIVRKMAVQIATEKSRGNATVTVPVHPEFAESLRAARAAGIIGAEVYTGKMVKGRVLPMNKKAWAAKFKKYAILAGLNEPKTKVTRLPAMEPRPLALRRIVCGGMPEGTKERPPHALPVGKPRVLESRIEALFVPVNSGLRRNRHRRLQAPDR